MISNLSWTDERIEQLKTLWAEGMSAGEIAREMGITRNAVLGKKDRLGLSKRRGGYANPAPDKVEKRLRRRRMNFSPQAPRLLKAPTYIEPHVEKPVRPVTLLELNETTCRWPIGDPQDADFVFCGARPETGLPYCSKHCRMAYNPRDAVIREDAA